MVHSDIGAKHPSTHGEWLLSSLGFELKGGLAMARWRQGSGCLYIFFPGQVWYARERSERERRACLVSRVVYTAFFFRIVLRTLPVTKPTAGGPRNRLVTRR